MASIKSEITKGVFWIAVAKYSGIFISLGITAILARNISPAAFGTMAIATVIMSFLDIFTDMGIGPAIIQFKDLTKYQINSLFVISCAIGIVLSVALYFLSVQIADYYNDVKLINVTRCLCLCLLFNAFNIVPNGLMLKAKRFKTVALRTLGFQILCGMIAVWGAMHGWGIYALIVTPVMTSVGVFIVNFINYPQRFLFDIDFFVIKRIYSYSSFQFLFSFTNYFSRNLDKLIIGKYFSMSQLGYYEKSYRLMQLPLQNVTFVISPVLHPILSSLQDNKPELAVKNQRLLSILVRISFPIGLILYFCAREIIIIIFGHNWMPSVPIFQILALSLPLQMLLSTSGSIFQAAGKTNHMFYTGICNTVITVTGFLIAAIVFRTLDSMAWAWNVTLAINFVNTYIVMNKRTFDYSLYKFAQPFVPQILNTFISAIIAYLLMTVMIFDNIILELLYKIVVTAVPTFVMAKILGQYDIIELSRQLLEKCKRK